MTGQVDQRVSQHELVVGVQPHAPRAGAWAQGLWVLKAILPDSSTTCCQGDAPQNGSRVTGGAWLLLLPLLSSLGLVTSYAPLLGLQAATANMASHCLLVCMLGLCFLCCRLLQVGRWPALILAQKLCVQVLLPIQRASWQQLAITWSWSLWLLGVLIQEPSAAPGSSCSSCGGRPA